MNLQFQTCSKVKLQAFINKPGVLAKVLIKCRVYTSRSKTGDMQVVLMLLVVAVIVIVVVVGGPVMTMTVVVVVI